MYIKKIITSAKPLDQKPCCNALVVDINRLDGYGGVKIHFLVPSGFIKGKKNRRKCGRISSKSRSSTHKVKRG